MISAIARLAGAYREMDPDLKIATVKTGIASSGLLYYVAGLPWGEIAAAATALFMLLQSYFLLRDKWWRDRKRRKEPDPTNDAGA